MIFWDMILWGHNTDFQEAFLIGRPAFLNVRSRWVKCSIKVRLEAGGNRYEATGNGEASAQLSRLMDDKRGLNSLSVKSGLFQSDPTRHCAKKLPLQFSYVMNEYMSLTKIRTGVYQRLGPFQPRQKTRASAKCEIPALFV